MRSINTSIVALIPVGAILYVGAVQLGSGPLKDLALALFVGMAAGAYSSIFIATPLLAHLKSREPDVQEQEKRVKARRRHQADRYASVPAFTEDLPIAADPNARRPVHREAQPAAAPVRRQPAAAQRPTPPAAGASYPRRAARCGRARPADASSRPGRRSPSGARSDRRPGTGRRRPTLCAAWSSTSRTSPSPAWCSRTSRRCSPTRRPSARSSRPWPTPGATSRASRVVDHVVGMEARGFILAAPVALALGAGFVPVRKAGKLPRETYAETYALEYGEATLEIHRDGLRPGDRVLLVDDVLATGGTVAATRRLVERCGAVAARASRC